MFATSPDPEAYEYVSGIALDVLDELRIRMMECRLVLASLLAEADLNFDELEQDLQAAQHGAQEAYEAASLVHQRAALEPRWGTAWSRPRAVFARHGAAVRQGANKIHPAPALGDRLERSLWQLRGVDRAADVVGARPKCSGTVRTTGAKCVSSAIYLGSGLFGTHCYSHATAEERDQYRAHHEKASSQLSNSHALLLDRQRAVGEDITEYWMQRREQRRQWIDKIDSATA
ncbi:hypothetical protein K1X22_06605 [Mycolicibacterium farcinogenes]|uniref:hypothetical protein n=1 Tax=Mycolicibacterium farcinogenes TaxID=1802 RepID=UPI001C8EC0DF|nr:hypothetical protein K1X22_06605 [Mycolicibacterium farcinogenes]